MNIEDKLKFIQQVHRVQDEHQDSYFKFFRFRLLISFILFLCFFLMEKNEIVYKDINSCKIVDYISESMKIDRIDDIIAVFNKEN